MDLALNDEHDISVKNGDLQTVEEQEGVAQWLDIGHKTLKGTWAFNVTNGLPLKSEFLVKSPNLNIVRSIMISQISSNPDIVSIDDLQVETERRSLSITYRVTTLFGAFEKEVEATTSGFWSTTIYEFGNTV